jgi:hypothetical protein
MLDPEGIKRRNRDSNLRSLYGITLDEFETRFDAQGGVCACCKKPPKPGKVLFVDHDHETGEVRGLVHNGCNRGLGLIGEDAIIAGTPAQYLLGRRDVLRSMPRSV